MTVNNCSMTVNYLGILTLEIIGFFTEVIYHGKLPRYFYNIGPWWQICNRETFILGKVAALGLACGAESDKTLPTIRQQLLIFWCDDFGPKKHFVEWHFVEKLCKKSSLFYKVGHLPFCKQGKRGGSSQNFISTLWCRDNMRLKFYRFECIKWGF
jgi:hypothetical protein